MPVEIALNRAVDSAQAINIYKANNWSAADKPDALLAALSNAHNVVSAHLDEQLIGLGYAISDGHLVVYYAHLLVHPAQQGQGFGTKMMHALMQPYAGFHMQMLCAEPDSIRFYEHIGFKAAGDTKSMWIFKGNKSTSPIADS